MARESSNAAVQRKQFLFFLRLVGALSLTLLILAIVLKENNSGPDQYLISESLDAIVFESMIVITGAFLATVLVGLMIDSYRSRFEGGLSGTSLMMQREGLLHSYNSSNDFELLEALEQSISGARERIRAVGLGLGILHNNRNLLNAIAGRINKASTLQVEIFLGSGDNAGVKNRIEEEHTWHKAATLNYDPQWVRNYPNEIRSVLRHAIPTEKRERVRVVEVDSCPMLGLIQIDDDFFMFPYGSPDLRGSESPWLHFQRSTDGSGQRFVQMFVRMLDFYSTSYHEKGLS